MLAAAGGARAGVAVGSGRVVRQNEITLQVHQPDFHDAGGGVARDLHGAVEGKRCVGDLDHQQRVAGAGSQPGVVIVAAPQDGDAPGSIDSRADALIEKARQTGWQACAVPGRSLFPPFTVFFDGKGRYNYERTLPLGLKERVICDGQHLLHLYAELGIGARRALTRFHAAEFTRLLPWLVPAARDYIVARP